ncbi:ABC transporter ATP-binding protein [Xanthomonas campestris pv. phormiicola]|nr:ABC transporter ATP-binding protein [Xanthomonas campestris pv. phormiicola]UYC14621.1 ABC transporter ATP-binding protein [Xanthomonas campestris pv. phormiicola]
MSGPAAPLPPPELRAEALRLAYPGHTVSERLELAIAPGKITAIIGPNACGKSTLLRALARLLVPAAGRVLLDGRDIHQRPSREVARRLGLLPQAALVPAAIGVAELVARGRFPHRRLLRQWSREDERAVRQAMADTGVAALAERRVDELSGGQRQRVWLAMALAQDTRLLLLDEPTTYLDVAHQLEVLDLCRMLNRRDGRTLVMVLHDLQQAARYADHIVAMKAGAIVAAGTPAQVLTPALVERVFGIRALVIADPVTATPLVVPVAVADGTHDNA